MLTAESRMRHRRGTERRDDRFRLLQCCSEFEGVFLNPSYLRSEGSPRGAAGDSELAVPGMMVEQDHELRTLSPAKSRPGRNHLGR
jgi:hypothetical protein